MAANLTDAARQTKHAEAYIQKRSQDIGLIQKLRESQKQQTDDGFILVQRKKPKKV